MFRNTKEFHKTTTKELLAVKDRVRNLINHWGEDGRYKEVVLKTIIQRFLPRIYGIGSGFIVKQTSEIGEHQSSNQIDLIIYDKSFPMLFQEGDFIIVTPDAVRGIIEVKSNLKNQGIRETIEKSNKNGKFIYDGIQRNHKLFFNGIFSYSGYDYLTNDQNLVNPIDYSWKSLRAGTRRGYYCVNHIVFNKHWFYKFWHNKYDEKSEPHYLYKIKNFAYSFFISNIMDYLVGLSIINNRNLWFPLDKSIENRRIF